ncbi:hypothetical protein ACFFX0_12370 [Citricoccus parietis]|uniref:Uncharacterized protein n=1 Tax=Citricoccus parietis TaxID=592307 RepID=A0ABV5FZ45_9MICC
MSCSRRPGSCWPGRTPTAWSRIPAVASGCSPVWPSTARSSPSQTW